MGDKYLFDKPIFAVAKCDANDDVLYVGSNDGKLFVKICILREGRI